jgi:hypothetical protein
MLNMVGLRLLNAYMIIQNMYPYLLKGLGKK